MDNPKINISLKLGPRHIEDKQKQKNTKKTKRKGKYGSPEKKDKTKYQVWIHPIVKGKQFLEKKHKNNINKLVERENFLKRL